MVNENNKFVLQAPKTYIVSELKDQEVKKSPLSLAARNKVVNRSGSSYQSPLIENDISEPTSYGPGDRSLVSISGRSSSFVKLIAAADASSLVGDLSGVKTCAAIHCWTSISSSEYYCSSHKNMVGESATNVAKSFDETANREGGLVVVSQRNNADESKTTNVKYHSFR